MKKLILLPLLFSAFCLSAFEAYGLKSGITKTEFYELVNCQEFIDKYNTDNPSSRYASAKELNHCSNGAFRGTVLTEELDYFEGIPSVEITLLWNHEDRLYRIQLGFKQPLNDVIEFEAFQVAVKETFPDWEIIDTNDGRLTISKSDKDLFNESFAYYKKQSLEKINQKK